MKDDEKTKSQLLQEVAQLREQIRTLEQADIERKRIEQSLQESEEKFRLIAEHIEEVFWMRSPGIEEMLYVSPAYETIWGRSRESLYASQQSFMEAIHPEDREKVFSGVDGHRQGVWNFEYRIVRPDGSIRWIHDHGVPIKDEQGNLYRMVGVARDVTERKIAEHALLESEQRFRGAFEYAAFGMALLNEQGRFIEVNCSLCEMFGYSQEEFLTKTFKDITYPQDLPVGSELFQDLRSGTRNFGWLEKRYVHKNGHLIWAFLSTSAVRDPQGNLMYSVSQIQDITKRKQTEEELQKTNTLLERIFANIHLSIAYLNVDFYFIRVNEAYAKAGGRLPDFFVGKNHFDLYPHTENEAIFRQVVETGEAYFTYAKPFEYPEHPEWGVTYWDWSLQPVKDEDGKVVELVFCLSDVTERIRAQELLREANRLLEQTFANLDDPVFVVDTATRTIISCNPAVERVFGYRTEEVLGRNTEFLHVDQAMYERFGQELFPVLDAEGVFRAEFLMRRKDGSIFCSEHTVTEILDEAGQRTGAVSLVRDITARKQAEEELTTYREHLEELVEARTTELQTEITERKRAEEEIKGLAKFPAENPNPVIRIAKDGTILYANSSSLCLLKAWGCQINQQLPPKWLEFTLNVFHAQTGQSVEVQCPSCQRVYSLTFAPIIEAGYVNIYGLDITMRKQSEKDLQQAKNALETANRQLEERVQEELKKHEKQQQLLIQRSKLESLGKLAAGIAHEINQPLAGISMGLDNVLLKLSSKKMTEEYLQQKIDVLLKHIDRIKYIIEHIRTFSREQVSTSIERVDVNEVCRNAISMLQTQYQNHNVIITSNLDETIGYVVGNTYKLEQVVLNLITNAKDAVDGKGHMIRNGSYQKRITLSTSCDVDRIYVDIEDNGVGISEEHIQNIFDPFFTTKDSEHGTGLGLSVSYGIIKEMQGDISVQSQLGEYTLMRISLPRVKDYKDYA